MSEEVVCACGAGTRPPSGLRDRHNEEPLSTGCCRRGKGFPGPGVPPRSGGIQQYAPTSARAVACGNAQCRSREGTSERGEDEDEDEERNGTEIEESENRRKRK